MDRSEALTQIYLESLGLGAVAYEPDGNNPPDFTLDGIAVEVRRLNRHHATGSGYEGLESGEASILRYVEKLLPKFGPPKDSQGWCVSWTFQRPLDGKEIKRALPKALADFQVAPKTSGLYINLTQTFDLEIRPASIPTAYYFVVGAYSDLDQGGLIAGDVVRNLNICIAEKAAKITRYRERYKEWWLVLPDFIGPNLSLQERQSIGEYVQLRTFSRVVLIHPSEPTKAFVLS